MSSTAEEIANRLRARVPRALLPALVAARTRLAWRQPAVREDARAQMRFLLEQTELDPDIDAVARAYVRYQARRGELRWHPELLTSLPVQGIDHLLAARDRGRGVVLNFVHHGYYDGAFPSVARLGAPAHLVVYPYMLEDDAPLWLRQHVKVGSSHGGTAVSAGVGTDGLLDLLRRGEVLAIASDVPGKTPISFVGRTVRGSFGAARLATVASAPVVVMTSEENADGPVIRLHEPLDPADFAAPEALLQRMLAIHESVILRWPEATDLPLSRWGTVEAEATSVKSRAAT
jgi:lauroyl/myristoyl acyltransferase